MFGIQTYFLSKALGFLFRIAFFSYDNNFLGQEIFLIFLFIDLKLIIAYFLNLKNNFGNYTFINVDLVDKENLRDAIEKANHDLYAFQSSIFTNNLDSAMQSFEKLQAKSVFINEQTAFRVDWMPFAGLKHSGYGVGGIKYTMEDMQINKMLVLKK